MTKHLLNYYVNSDWLTVEKRKADIALLNSRKVQDADTYPDDTLHIHKKNVDIKNKHD